PSGTCKSGAKPLTPHDIASHATALHLNVRPCGTKRGCRAANGNRRMVYVWYIATRSRRAVLLVEERHIRTHQVGGLFDARALAGEIDVREQVGGAGMARHIPLDISRQPVAQ